MKKAIITSLLFFSGYYSFAQNREAEDEIRKLEQMEVQAVLTKDTVTLKKLWDKAYVVNNPANRIVLAKPNPIDRPVLNEPARVDFTREVEHISIHENIAVSMGNETVVPSGNVSEQQKKIKRRYTNIWMKTGGEWKLIARHANEICTK